MEEQTKESLLEELYFRANKIIEYNWTQEQKSFEEYAGVYKDEEGKWRDGETDKTVDIRDILDCTDHIFADIYFANEMIEQIRFLEEKEHGIRSSR